MKWIRKLIGWPESVSQGRSVKQSDWMSGQCLETAFLFDNASSYFQIAARRLNETGAERWGQVKGRPGTIIDKWILSTGQEVFVGYRCSDNVDEMMRDFRRLIAKSRQ